MKLVNLNEVVKDVDFMVFKSALENNGYVKGINVKIMQVIIQERKLIN